MKVKVANVQEIATRTSKKTNKPYKLTTFTDETGKLYKEVFGEFTVGQEIEGEWKSSEYGDKFEVNRGANSSGRRFGKSPEEMESIERQSTLSTAERLVSAYYSGKPQEAINLEDYAEKVSRTGKYLYNNLRTQSQLSPKESAAVDTLGGEVVDSGDSVPSDAEVESFDSERDMGDL